MTHVGRASISGLSCPRHTGGAKCFVITGRKLNAKLIPDHSTSVNIG